MHGNKSRSALPGLTAGETSEFQELGQTAPAASEVEAITRDARWIELYLKQEAAEFELARKRKRGPLPGSGDNR